MSTAVNGDAVGSTHGRRLLDYSRRSDRRPYATMPANHDTDLLNQATQKPFAGRAGLRLLMICDARLFLEVLLAAFERAGHGVVGWCSPDENLAAAVARHQPDVCVVALSVTDDRLLAAARAIGDLAANVSAMVITDLVKRDLMRPMLAAGVRGLLDRRAPFDDLLHGLERLAGGELVVDDARRGESVRPSAFPAPAKSNKLTRREQEVLARITAGDGTAEIATALNIRPSTARSHVQNVRHKLGVRTRLQAVAQGVNGLPPVSEP